MLLKIKARRPSPRLSIASPVPNIAPTTLRVRPIRDDNRFARGTVRPPRGTIRESAHERHRDLIRRIRHLLEAAARAVVEDSDDGREIAFGDVGGDYVEVPPVEDSAVDMVDSGAI